MDDDKDTQDSRFEPCDCGARWKHNYDCNYALSVHKTKGLCMLVLPWSKNKY